MEIQEKKKSNELTKRAKKHAKKQKGIGYFTNFNAGNVEHNIAVFNHVMGSDAGATTLVGGGDGAAIGEDLNLDETIEKHEELNPILWDSKNNLLEDVKKAIEAFVFKYHYFLEQDLIPCEILDIVIVGSNASYNYTSASDLDVHVIVNPDIVNDASLVDDPSYKIDLLYKLYQAYKVLYLNKYKVTIRDIPLELYIEKEKTEVNSQGIYSLSKNSWLKVPIKEKIPDLTESDDFEKIFNEWEERYFKLLGEKDNDKLVNDISLFLFDLYALRKKEIKEKGEYSIGNLVFKEFRNLGYIQKLKDTQIDLEIQKISI